MVYEGEEGSEVGRDGASSQASDSTAPSRRSKLVSGNVERTVKDTEDIDVPVIFDEIGDSVMPVEEDAHMARRRGVAIADFREGGENLRPLIDSLNRAARGVRVLCGDVLENVFEPALGLLGPAYFCHERMRRPISSLEMVRFASESASPRSTMT